MPYGNRDKTTIYISKRLMEQAKLKSGLSGSKTVEMLLEEYVSLEGDIEELERKQRESEEIIKKEETRIKQLDKQINDLMEEMKANGQNAIKINECLERIDYYYSKNGYITLSFLKRLSKAKRVEFSKLNDLTLQREYEIVHD